MLLRRITEHASKQDWFAVLVDFLIVVIGILIAFQITNWNEAREEKANLINAEDALKWDLFTNYYNAQERLVLVDCRITSLQALGEQLLAPNDQWSGHDIPQANSDLRTAFNHVLRSPSRQWGSRIWQAELARGTFNAMDSERRAALDMIFTQAKYLELLQDEIIDLQAGLGVLSQSVDLPYSARLRYYEQLSLIDQKSASLDLGADQIAAKIEEVGIMLSKAERAGLRDTIAENNKRDAADYGACRKTLVIPFVMESFSGTNQQH